MKNIQFILVIYFLSLKSMRTNKALLLDLNKLDTIWNSFKSMNSRTYSDAIEENLRYEYTILIKSKSIMLNNNNFYF
jgi:hypothetical protein